MAELLLVLSCIGAVLAGFFGLVSLVGWRSRRSEVASQLDVVTRVADSGGGKPQILHAWNERIAKSAWGKQMATRLAQADLDMSPSTYAAALLGVWLLIFVASSMFFQPPVFISVLFSSALVWLASRFFLETRRDHYLSQLANQMPDVALLVSNSIKAGLSVVQAFEVASEKMPRPSGTEFGRVVKQLRLGDPFDQAIERMMERLPCEELGLLLKTVAIQRKAGGNLSRALSVMSTAISARHRVRNEISTLTAEARFTGLIIMVLPVITLAMLNQTMEGAVSTFLNDPLGWVITTVFIAVLVAAFVLINRFAHVRV